MKTKGLLSTVFQIYLSKQAYNSLMTGRPVGSVFFVYDITALIDVPKEYTSTGMVVKKISNLQSVFQSHE